MHARSAGIITLAHVPPPPPHTLPPSRSRTLTVARWSTWPRRSSREARRGTTWWWTGGRWECSCTNCSRVSPLLLRLVRTTPRRKSLSECGRCRGIDIAPFCHQLSSVFTCRRILSEEPFFPDRLSSNCRDLMTSLLAKNPEKRLGAGGIEDVKRHPWFKVASAVK